MEQATNNETGNTENNNQQDTNNQQSQQATQTVTLAEGSVVLTKEQKAALEKTSKDTGAKAFLTKIGIDVSKMSVAEAESHVKGILESHNTALQEAESQKDIATKYLDLQKVAGENETALQNAQAEIAKMQAENTMLQRINELAQHGYFGIEAEGLAYALGNRVSDEKDFSSLLAEHVAANPRSDGKPKVPQIPGQEMGNSGNASGEAETLKAQYKKAIEDKDMQTKQYISRLAHEKGINLHF